MDDRELLLRAAKAAGMPLGFPEGLFWSNELRAGPGMYRIGDRNQPVNWNPLTDDGDCARMEAACGITVRWNETLCFANKASWKPQAELYADHNNDRNAARRRASTRAAAALGDGK